MTKLKRLTAATSLALSLPLLSLSTQSLATELNDTGLGDNNYSTEATNYYFERLEMTDFPGQDPQFGRDAAAAEGKLSKLGGGRRGFDFSDQNDCVMDNVTGLVWEMKTNASHRGLHSNKWTFSWYDASLSSENGRPNGGICFDEEHADEESKEQDRISCDTAAYIAKMNEVELCGYNDWRLPNREELRSIVDYSQPNVDTLDYEHILPSIDQDYFPHTLGSGYWTGNVYLGDKKRAWTVDFEHGGDSNREKTMPASIRLVSDAEREKESEVNQQRYEIQSSNQSETSAANSEAQTDAEQGTEQSQEYGQEQDEEKGLWDSMLGVFSDDDEVPAVETPDAEATDRMSDNMAAEAEATEMATETTAMTSEATSTAEAAPESVEAMSETAEEAPEESGFFQKVQDLF